MVEDDSQIVRYVLANPGISSADLSQHFDVSERTIRTYVKRANERLDGFACLVKKNRGGYSVKVTDGPALNAWLESMHMNIARGNMQPEDRVAYLLNDLLDRTDWVTVDELCHALCVSRPTVSGDLKRVEERLEEFGLKIEKRPHYGIRVIGEELSRRLCLASSVVESLAREEAATGKALPGGGDKTSIVEGAQAGPCRMTSLDKIAKIVDAAVDEFDFQINSLTYQNLLVHISIALMRIQEGNYVPVDLGANSCICDDRVADVAAGIAARIRCELGVELPESERSYIAIHLAGKEMIADPDTALEGKEGEETGLVISEEVWSVVTQMLEVVWKSFRYDFRDDLELRMNLARHIVPLVVRLRYHLHIDNPILTDIRRRYPLAYSMALDSSAVLAEHYGATLSENEVGFIAMAFALSLERHRTELPKKNILVVCASGRGSARMLEYRYRQEFGAYVDSIQTCDVAHVSKADFSKIDYVFTTVPLREALPVPVRQIEFFFDDAEVREVRRLLSTREPDALDPSFAARFSKQLFFAHKTFASKKEALVFLCKQMEGTGRVAENFSELVMRREDCVATSFGNEVAMPHPLEPVCDRSFAAVTLLDEPLDWGNGSVKAIFMVAISTEDNDELGGMFDVLAEAFNDADGISKLMQEQSYEALMDLFAAHSRARAGTDRHPA